ncbi:YjcZ family sporulation protein [Bacillus mojavensis]|nr:YjcZ family sporulation protein [Bacillus mojavensis]MEC1754800.1 YjcZ family sporulation protein [Bacillus mojavensis]
MPCPLFPYSSGRFRIHHREVRISFALIVVLFILLIIVGTRLLSLQYSAVRQYHCPAAFF